jgi:hypothetical protein
MTDNLAVFIGHQRDHAVAGFSQFFYEFSLSRLAEGRRNDLVNSFPVAWAFIADVNHPPDLSTERNGLASMGLLRIESGNLN